MHIHVVDKLVKLWHFAVKICTDFGGQATHAKVSDFNGEAEELKVGDKVGRHPVAGAREKSCFEFVSATIHKLIAISELRNV